ncbi:S1 family peptidase [Flexivirga sp. B27]
MPLPPTRLNFGAFDSIEETGITSLQSAVFPLVVVTPTEVTGIGTAFCVAGAGVLATARHVIDAANRLVAEAKATHADQAWLAALWYGDPPGDAEGVLSLLVPITDVCSHPDTRFDFALLTAAVPSLNNERIRFPSLQINFSMPRVGDEIIMLGYTGFQCERTQDSLKVEQTLRASRGVIRDRYYPMRDRLSAPFPCFGTTARCDPGMSGGPAMHIKSDGAMSVVGLNFSDYDDTDATEHASFATAVRTLLPMEVAMVNYDGDRITRSLLDLGRDEYIVSDTNFDNWRLEMTEHGVTVAVHSNDGLLGTET